MGFLELLGVASAPILQVLLVSAVGAFLATSLCNNLLSPDFRKSLNKLVFTVFTPSLVFASFARTVSLQDMISWWFMPVNVALTFLIGGIIGWMIVKCLKPDLKLEGLIIASCSSGNLGNLPIVIIPAICFQQGGPFGDRDACHSAALSYSSFSMALGGVFIWTYTYQIMRSRSMKFKALEAAEVLKVPNKDLEAHPQTRLLEDAPEQNVAIQISTPNCNGDSENQNMVDQDSSNVNEPFFRRFIGTVGQILEELKAPPTIAIILGFLFGGVSWLRNLIVGEDAPLAVIQNSIQLMGEGTIPCITILLGGNLTQGLRSSSVRLWSVVSIVVSKYIVIPIIGLFIVKVAANLKLLPPYPLFQYVLVMQYAMPPAMNISTMAQLFDVGQEECSVILFWTYGAAAIALTVWSTVLMWMLS
ncbi:protein PIN-LIKES 7 isoform X1 [Prosopis cineraria]|uniref:protein PIN-LIKES 7 isoform X1 n=1 Tax=Prosopis cineraria TaxID=364024 RepID=UPI0024107AAA|nr:protein PIN-LIKES 7 isoform X1 [Prosopis cineraria]XP_054823236.1 protein PIN-LIKES 7 isoform X1 [Prosopis cineraria]